MENPMSPIPMPETLLQSLEVLATALSALFVVFLPLELWRRYRAGRLDRHSVREMLASASPLLPTLLAGPLVLAFIAGLYTMAYAITPLRLPTTWGTAALALLLVDFLYYWDHRAAHRVRAYWAIAHSVHHSSWQYDQTTAFRISFVDGFTSPWFYVPAVLLGFHPMLVAACLGLILAYQQWLHTETVGRLGWLDAVFNTPSNHRAHHAIQPQYIDRNYGAVLMVWDRLFGTYVRENDTPVYGLTEQIGSAHPWRVHAAEALKLWRDLKQARNWRTRWALLCCPPDWKPAD
jgi:sterol desaturase/sphingolipid hydroxylase (fatty acid hydroxylase superfamily)